MRAMVGRLTRAGISENSGAATVMSSSPETKTLTQLQRRFVEAYVRLGSVTRAAQEAGLGTHPRSSQASGSRLLAMPHVQAALREELAQRVEGQAPAALNVLLDVMNDPAALPRDRIRAAEAVLDRGFLSRTSRLEATVEHTSNPADLIRAVWEAREARLALSSAGQPPHVIDAEPEDADGSAALPAPRQDAA